MAVTVTIAGTDRTSSIRTDSLQWTENLTNKVDTLTFEIVGSAALPFSLALRDTVAFAIDSTTVFGGRVISYKDSVEGAKLFKRSVTCKDYTMDVDKFIHSGTYTDRQGYSILRDIHHTYNKRNETRIADMETDETWTSSTADTSNYREGTQSQKVTSTTTTYSTATRTLSSSMSLSSYIYIEYDYYVESSTNCGGVQIKLGNSALTSYYSYEITSGFVTGWNKARVLETAFTSTGTPSWAAIQGIEIAGKSSSAVSNYISFDDLYASTAASFTMTNVQLGSTVIIESAKFSSAKCSDCVKKIANLIEFDYFWDADKDLHFFSTENNTAPYELTDSSGYFDFNTLELESDISSLRNVIYVFGGDAKETATQTEQLDSQANGSATLFQLGYRYKDYSLTVAGVATTVGVDGNDSLTSHQSLYNVEEKTLEFATAPASAAAVRFTGYRLYPLKYVVGEAISIITYGEHELVIKDENITTSDAAIQRALAEFTTYAAAVVDGKVNTDTAGFRSGQKIHVDSDTRSIDEWYIIQSIRGRMRTHNEMTFTLNLVSAKTWDMVQILQELLLDRVKELDDYDDNHLVTAAFELVEVSETVTASTGTESTETVNVTESTPMYWMSQPMTWVAGNYEVSITLWNTTDLTRTPCADGGAYLAS